MREKSEQSDHQLTSHRGNVIHPVIRVAYGITVRYYIDSTKPPVMLALHAHQRVLIFNILLYGLQPDAE
jgi:hypothetical protein